MHNAINITLQYLQKDKLSFHKIITLIETPPVKAPLDADTMLALYIMTTPKMPSIIKLISIP